MRKAQEAIDAAKVRVAQMPETALRENLEMQLRGAQRWANEMSVDENAYRKDVIHRTVFRMLANVEAAAEEAERAELEGGRDYEKGTGSS